MKFNIVDGGISDRAISNFGPKHGVENRKGNDFSGGHEV